MVRRSGPLQTTLPRTPDISNVSKRRERGHARLDIKTEIAICIVLVPAFVTLVLTILGQRFSQNRYCALLRTFAIDVGFLGAFLVLPWTQFVPAERWHWIPYLTATAAGLQAIPWERKIGVRGRRTLWILFFFFLALLLVPKWLELLEWRGGLPVRAYWVVAMGVSILLLWISLDRMSRQFSAGFTGVVWIAFTVAVGVILFDWGNIKFAELAAALAVALSAGTFVACWTGEKIFLQAAAPTVAVALPALLINGRLYSITAVPMA